MAKENLNKWTKLANELKGDEVRLPVGPVPVVMAEATQAAHFVEKYWTATAERPGLEVTAEVMPKSIADDILSLVKACQTAHAAGVFADKSDASAKAVERAREVAGELAATLEFVLDDGKTTTSDDALVVAKGREASSGSIPQVAQSLVDFTTIAERELAALKKIKSFDAGIIAEARKLSAEIIAKPTAPGRVASDAVQLRDRLLVLLGQKVAEVRRTARFVFRNFPHIQKLATSSYQRRRRAAQRKGNGSADVTMDDAATSP